MRLFFMGVFLPLAVTGCVTAPTEQATGTIDVAVENSKLHSDPDAAIEGLAFAQARCAGCHKVADGQVMPNPSAPSFEAIANARGLTHGTLKAWLRDSHNYPGQMNFEIGAKHIDDLAAYMLTLKSQDYRPPIQ